MSESNGAPPPPGPAAGPGGMMSQMGNAHDAAVAQFRASDKAMKMLDSVRTHLEALTKLGDTVTIDDVIETAGKLVAAGSDAKGMAALMAGMPPGGGGPQLAGWIAEQTAAVQQKEGAMAQAHEAARHALGVSALQGMAAHSLQHGPMAPQGGPMSQGGPMPGGPAGSPLLPQPSMQGPQSGPMPSGGNPLAVH